MRAFARDAWLEALRSGEFPQTQNVLTSVSDVNGEQVKAHCCLGVLTEVARAAGIELEIKGIDDADGTKRISYDDNTQVLPDAVAEWAGIDVTDDYRRRFNNPAVYVSGREDIRDGRYRLSDLNDMWGFSFEEIANVIETETAG